METDFEVIESRFEELLSLIIDPYMDNIAGNIALQVKNFLVNSEEYRGVPFWDSMVSKINKKVDWTIFPDWVVRSTRHHFMAGGYGSILNSCPMKYYQMLFWFWHHFHISDESFLSGLDVIIYFLSEKELEKQYLFLFDCMRKDLVFDRRLFMIILNATRKFRLSILLNFMLEPCSVDFQYISKIMCQDAGMEKCIYDLFNIAAFDLKRGASRILNLILYHISHKKEFLDTRTRIDFVSPFDPLFIFLVDYIRDMEQEILETKDPVSDTESVTVDA